MRTHIANGTVVNATGMTAADVLIEDERILALVSPGSEPSLAFASGADRRIDAAGKLVVPGGIDVHTHFDMPFGGTMSNDTFESGTTAAAFGGTTTIIDFCVQSKGHSLREAWDTWDVKASGNCSIDYGFHMIVSQVDEQSLKEMDLLVDEGITSFKLFMAYPGVLYSTDGEIFRAMQQAASNGATILMHAENGIAIDVLVAQALSRGETDPKYHAMTRPAELEGEAAFRAIQLARVAGCPLYIVHLTAMQALAAVTEARDEGLNVFAETCPQYLFLSDADLARPGFEGAKFVCSPPLRPAEHHAALWRGLRTNDLSIVSTDHCPFCFKGQKDLGVGDFTKIPNGLPVVENRMDLIHDGVVRGEITTPRWVEICATTPARMFGLYPKKGVIQPGSDADVVVYDPNATHVISASTHHMRVDYSCFEGLEVTGHVETVLARGEVIIENGTFKGQKGRGHFLERGKNQYLS
ncbi:MAG: dihydropyrimidinase [Acidimicrobiales bacterium]